MDELVGPHVEAVFEVPDFLDRPYGELVGRGRVEAEDQTVDLDVALLADHVHVEVEVLDEDRVLHREVHAVVLLGLDQLELAGRLFRPVVGEQPLDVDVGPHALEGRLEALVVWVRPRY